VNAAPAQGRDSNQGNHPEEERYMADSEDQRDGSAGAIPPATPKKTSPKKAPAKKAAPRKAAVKTTKGTAAKKSPAAKAAAKKIPAEAGPKASASTAPPVQPRPAAEPEATTGAPVGAKAATGAPVGAKAATGAPVGAGRAAPRSGFGTGSAARFPLAIGLGAVSLSALLLRRLRRR
jgi:uncharacterized membrane protein